MAFIIRNVTGSAIVLDDIGITIPANSLFDLTAEQPNDIASSDDLKASVSAGDIRVLDPLTTGGSPVHGGSPEVYLTNAEGEFVVGVHNDPHFRINGATLNQLEDVDLTGANPGDVLQLGGSPEGIFVITPPDVAFDNAISLNQLTDVNSPFTGGSPQGAYENGALYVFQGNGSSQVDLVPFFGGSPEVNPEFCEAVQDIAGLMIQGGSPKPHTDITVTYTDGAGLCDGVIAISVDDNFLRNTGDVLDSGTLEIASGANITVGAGADLTIIDPPVNPEDAVNKEYVDSIASGLDPKESVLVATTVDIGGSYSSVGGSPEVPGAFSNATGVIDGVAVSVGDRVLIKNQIDPRENGIYVVTNTSGSPLTADYQRAPDQDGSPASEVSAGNFTFVETGDTQATTGWVTAGTGILDLNVDPIVWVQFSESTQITAGLGISQAGTVLDLDANDLATATVSPTDEIVFHDADGTPAASGSQTRKTTVQDFIDDLGLNQTDISASEGVEIVLVGSPQVQDIRLDFGGLPADTVEGADVIAFLDVSGSPQVHNSVTAQDFLDNLNVVSNVDTTGIIINTGGSPAFVGRAIEVEGTGSPIAGPLNGLAITDGDGVNGNPTVGLNIVGLPVRSDAVDTTDRIPVYNQTTGRNEYYTVAEVAGSVSATDSFTTWQGAGNIVGSPATIVAGSSSDTANIIAGDGIELTFVNGTNTITWAFSNAGLADTAVEGTDTFAFFDGSNGDEPESRSFNDLISDLDLTVGGLDATDVSGSEGTTVVLVGSPQTPDVRLDLNGLPSGTIDQSDELVFFDANGSPQSHRKTTVADFLTDLGLDEAPITASDGIEINLVGSPQVQDVSLDFFSLPSTPAELTDIVAFGDVSGSPQLHAGRTFGELLTDLDVLQGKPGNGIVAFVGSPGTLTERTIEADGVGLLDGLAVTNGDGQAGNPTIGLDIDGTPAAGEELAAADELIIKNASAGTGSPLPGENQKITGQELADGVLAISGLGGLSVTSIGGQEILTLVDTTRSNKVLSIETSALTWMENNVTNNDWMQIGNATDADTGFIVPLDATIVKISAHTADDNGNSKDLNLYVDGALNTAGIVSFTAVSGENEFTDNTLNIDVAAGAKLRLRGAPSGGRIEDTVVTIWLKWRG